MKFLLISTLLSTFGSVSAFPTGAAGCNAGPAVGGSHLETSATLFRTGPLEEGSIVVSLNGVPIDPNVPMGAPTGETHTLSIEVVGVNNPMHRPFRGFLMRLEGAGVDLNGAFDLDPADAAVQDAFVCTGMVGGVTHTTNDDKTMISADFMLDDAATRVSLDVTVVIENRDGKSAYFYSPFQLNTALAPTDGGMGMGDKTAMPSDGVTMDGTIGETMAESSAASGVGVEIEK